MPDERHHATQDRREAEDQGALREKLAELTGKQTRSNNRPYLLEQVTKALAEQAAREAKAKSQRASKKPRERDPRLPPVGTVR